ncbi:hypothetical protein N7471_008963 [Penicillium samsonianum]|uniref:uncharacterized protein n=1 Tax=Penicillium samsonianum TaxID=1882272 RepID=UPI0025480B48|nr:uncharacterized protein N7471_008963 [Penicillium samsonianum]KAJ6127746.1 hypothetical protein N7471_008963 [Penicillium samsonianum]
MTRRHNQRVVFRYPQRPLVCFVDHHRPACESPDDGSLPEDNGDATGIMESIPKHSGFLNLNPTLLLLVVYRAIRTDDMSAVRDTLTYDAGLHVIKNSGMTQVVQ